MPVQLLAAATLVLALLVAAAYSAAIQLAPTGGAMPTRPSNSNLPVAAPISENEANSLVWALPEVQIAASQIRARGARPITYTVDRPVPNTGQADYVIAFAEDGGSHVTTVDTFVVDPYTRQISFYDPVQDRTISLDQWRASQ